MSNITDFYTKKDAWSLEHTIDVIDECVEDCLDCGDDLKGTTLDFTLFQLKALVDKIKGG